MNTPMAVDWCRHWETVYQTRPPTLVNWYQEHPAASRDLIRRTGVRRTAPIIDVDGGSSRVVDGLLAGGFRDVTAVDVSATAFRYARGR